MVRPFVLIFWSQLANASGARVKEANHLFNSDPSNSVAVGKTLALHKDGETLTGTTCALPFV